MGFGPRFEIPHTIDGEKVVVVMRPAHDGDAEKMAALLQDFTVQQFLYIQGGVTPKDEAEVFERARTSREQVLWIVSLVRDTESESIVGMTSLRKHRGNRYTSFIVLADRNHWGKGIARLTHQLRTWYAFCELGAYAIKSGYIEDNVSSGKALTGVGYVEIGRDWRAHLTNGRWCDEVSMVCYNPLTLGVLWPDGDVPEAVRKALPKTHSAFELARDVLKPR
ncbi:GNAT family N-acetyltransferase [Streptomyces sp. cg40]|uniref:GNAT family N-acetyltransferase n=1 Tax=Streptomyces sp. cg40 TaxID=3419764 RepID=UPI003D08FA70